MTSGFAISAFMEKKKYGLLIAFQQREGTIEFHHPRRH
jgi:hypothetical protein